MIHFFQSDADDKSSVDKLRATFELIRNSDPEILICVILRDSDNTKQFNKNEYPLWLPHKDYVDKLISLVYLSELDYNNKIYEIEKVLQYFNSKVRSIKNTQPLYSKCKFTKKRFL